MKSYFFGLSPSLISNCVSQCTRATRKTWQVVRILRGVWHSAKNRDYEEELELELELVEESEDSSRSSFQAASCSFFSRKFCGFALAHEAICAGSPLRKDFGTKGHGSSLTFRPSVDLPPSFP